VISGTKYGGTPVTPPDSPNPICTVIGIHFMLRVNRVDGVSENVWGARTKRHSEYALLASRENRAPM